MSKQQTLFNDRALEQLTGHNMIHNAKTAIIELVANAWDAGANRVDITWPENKTGEPFSIKDNGCGLTKEEFAKRWMQVGYNRQEEQGILVDFPKNSKITSKRKPYGRNGLGRFSAFKFSTPYYYVCTAKDGETNSYSISKSRTKFLNFDIIDNEKTIEEHGTIVYAREINPISLSVEDVKTEIGMRFLVDPLFSVFVNGEKVSFFDIPDVNKQILSVELEGKKIEIIAIDIHSSDRTTYHHGVAWHVNGRLVGECSWKGDNAPYNLDGRTVAAKRFTFIVIADCLDQEGYIKPDWSGFNKNQNPEIKKVFDAVHQEIKSFVLSLSENERKITRDKIYEAAKPSLRKLSLEELEIWEEFVQKVQEDCPSIGDSELENIAKILAGLEASKSKYALLEKMSTLRPDEFDNLDLILGNWTVRAAKAVLDEIQQRIALVHELDLKVNDDKTDEVQELQPLFNNSLWIFGPEFETIEYTSNQGMTTVIKKLMKVDETGSRQRPDFAILPDGSCSLMSLPKYDLDAGGVETGVDRLVIVELKKPSVPVSQKEKDQPLKYVKELDQKGYLDAKTKITCYVLSKTLDQYVGGKTTHQDGRITIIPMLYQTVLNNARSRLFNLQKKVQDVMCQCFNVHFFSSKVVF